MDDSCHRAVVGRRRIRAVSALHHMTPFGPMHCIRSICWHERIRSTRIRSVHDLQKIAFHTNPAVTDPPDGLLMSESLPRSLKRLLHPQMMDFLSSMCRLH